MLGKMLRENRKAYTLLFLLDHAIQDLQDWVLHKSGPSYDKDFHDQLLRLLDPDSKRTDKAGYSIELLGTCDRKHHPWVLNNLQDFVNHCENRKSNRQDSGGSEQGGTGSSAGAPKFFRYRQTNIKCSI